MANTKEYKIVINGLTESINAVESLNKQLDNLEKRMNAINATKVSTGGGSSRSGGGSSALSEEEAVQREINKLKQQGAQLDAKIAASQDEIYKRVDATKQLLKETIADQKAIAAQERLTADAYSNTMAGMKAKLADIKAVINTTDLGDGDKIKQMTKDADELNTKLLEIEKSYGQYGRNVGNYANGVAEGLQKVKITVGDTVREFDNAKQASKTLNGELKTMAANGQQDTEAFKQLQQAVMELDSNIADAKKPMDALMDSMEGVMAVANAGQGLRALFGVDDAEIQKSIQKLVALQNTLKGLETINKQIQTREGVGKWIAPFTTGIDKATKKLLTYNTALLGTGKASKVAAVGIKAFGTALKAAISMGILVVVDLLVEGLMDLVDSFKKVDKAAEAAKEAEEEVAKAYANGSATLLKYQTIVNNFNGSKQEEERLVKQLNSELGSSLGTYKTLGEWMDVLTKKGQAYIQMLMLQAKAQAAFNNLVKAQQAQMDASNSSTEDYRTFLNDIQDFLWPGWGEKSANKARVAAKQSAVAYTQTCEEELKKSQVEVEKFMQAHKIGDYAPQLEKNSKASGKKIKEVDDELNKLRIRNMKEGLNKIITQLEEERKAELKKAEESGREVGEKRLEINRYYNDRILEEIKTYSQKTEQLYKSLNDSVRNYQIKNLNSFIDIINKQVDLQKDKLQNAYKDVLNQGLSSYGIQGKNQLSSGTRGELFILSEDKGEFMDDAKLLVERYRNLQSLENAYNAMLQKRSLIYDKLSDAEKKHLDDSVENTKQSLEEKENLYKEYNDKLIDKYGSGAIDSAFNILLQENYTEKLSSIFNQRYTIYESYWDSIISFAKESSEEEKKYSLLKEDSEYEKRKDDALKYYNEQLKISNDYYDAQEQLIEVEHNKGLTTDEEYYEDLERLNKEYTEKQLELEEDYQTEKETLERQHQQNIEVIQNNGLKKLQNVNKEYFEFRLQELRDFQTAISNLEQKQPVINAWGITDLSKTNENNRNLLDSYETLAKQIVGIKNQLQAKLKANEISFDDFQNANRELDSFVDNVGQKMDEVKYKLSLGGQIQQIAQDIQVYVQEIASSFNQIMQAVWSYQDNVFDDEQEEIDKANDELEKALDKQQQIVEDHKNAIESIEDELAKARGSRRQHLIDQLNAEMAAQREAAAQEKKIQQQKEAQQKKQDELDRKRKKAQYQRDMMQAVVNGAMAVTYAAVNAWPIPAIPMMALAAATTAAQIALMASNKPYAKGGQLDGPSHREGGIKVPGIGGGIELEGQEYVIRKKTTNKNVDLLDYINKSEKKLTLDDFIDFYGTKARRTIKSISPKGKYADGGMIPTLSSNNIDINDKLISALEAYAERPSVVAVTDIIDRADSVRAVQVLAGLTD